MAAGPMFVDFAKAGEDLARKTVFIKLHLGLLGNNRKVSSSQVEVDAEEALMGGFFQRKTVFRGGVVERV